MITQQENSAPQTPPKNRVWKVSPALPSSIQQSLNKYHPVLVQLLYNRGISNTNDANNFISHKFIHHNPLKLPNMDKAILRIRKAIENNENVAVFGDFDVDGVTATAIISKGIERWGIQAIPYIPHRANEGHGLSTEAIQTLADKDVKLMITVDCGITAHNEIIFASQLGIDTIITDHHIPDKTIPAACAIINPRLSTSLYPFPDLTGAGLALKLMQGLYESFDLGPTDWEHLLTLAALGTVSDMAPLHDENRSIVHQGVKVLSTTPSPGLKALITASKLTIPEITTESISWSLSPRLNSAGRMTHAQTSYNLLVTDSVNEAEALATTLNSLNNERRKLSSNSLAKARQLVTDKPLIMISDPSFTPGIIGLVAGKLKEEFYRPAIIISQGEKVSTGSCRSIPKFDIGSALNEVESMIGGFVRHGGHPQAAGFTIETHKLPKLQYHMENLAKNIISTDSLETELKIELELPLGSIPKDIYQMIQSLAPMGIGNPVPVFLSRMVNVINVKKFGIQRDHVKLKVEDRGIKWDAIAFKAGKDFPINSRQIDIVYTIDIDHWHSDTTLRLTILDAQISAT